MSYDTFPFDNQGRPPHIFRLAEKVGIDAFKDRYFADTEGAYTELQERYYPDAWMFTVGDDQEPAASYTVKCSTPAELALAYSLRPKGISAHIILEPAQQNGEIVQKQ